ncbi:gliding motility-associated C-terminal domain-containing protein [Allomuricauda sp. CP2A]|jgi:gliding motility-associated-like protein|uniref:T9SS type B sorting domain-containing protein n=1 Tax=Allomuricauda sp. CP2A TaxID=1848189 RepID=UPI00082C9FE9|nr:gliding motility-associated C-terminal domain-containing protein [Muricauda sp. CP2A]
MKKSSSTYGILVLAIAMLLMGTSSLVAQVLNKPTAADNPNLAGNSAWTAACASGSFNEYFVNFTWSPPLVDSNNEFILELSDSYGNFGSPRELARVADKNTVFDFEFEFALPDDIRGEGYKFRVRSTSPAKTSPASDAYSMFYIDYNLPLLISENGSGSIPAGGVIQICDGGSVTLKPHNIPNADTYLYNWYRSGTLLAQKTESITVSTPGMYYVELDYGSVCSGSANTLSNTIEINNGSSMGIAINGDSDIELCPGAPHTLEANISGMGLTYTWYKDGNIISGPTLEASTLAINTSVDGFEGDYEVQIGGASACTERSSAVVLRSAGSFEVSRQNEENIVLLPSQTKTLSVSTTASSPTYQWYKDGTPITNATSSSLVINEVGEYYAEVTENGGSCSSGPKNSEITTIVSPDSFELEIEFIGAYSDCENTDATISLAAVNAVSDNGAKTDVTSELESAFAYQWKLDGASISGETSKTITVSNHEKNGAYKLDGTLDGFNATSNTLNVTLSANQSLNISANGTVLCEGGEAITLTSSQDLSDQTFEWKKDGQVVDTSSESYTVNEVGAYQLIIRTNDCPIVSNEVTIRAFDDSLLALDKPKDLVIIEGETETITASGADSYEWFDANNNLIGTQDSYGFQQEGEYLLVANFGNCTVSKLITVTFRDMFAIPNVITANGDGINDLWVLPNTYSRDQNVLVTIFNERGEQIFSQTAYENNWPQSTMAFNKPSMIFYYKITRGGNSLKQGTITVIK